ncbi:acyl-CoA thioesterase [Nesterenkonia salmonea]|uniref:Acyl-CoA thioesterase n=2 Tax=Nesterenkonia salmonea TaxID=1804987 RepID=A0A5R9BKI1_9MICC|nr:acyl-CoA thioesterase [Nesterenkonia salmonea]
MNNTTYYEAMDTAINTWLIRSAGLDPAGETIGLCVASSCEFHAPASYPEELVVEVGTERVGRTSIAWRLRILRSGGAEVIAVGSFTHVFVDSTTRRPTPIPESIRQAVAELHA